MAPVATSNVTPEYDEHVVKALPYKRSVAWDRWNQRKGKLGKGYLSFETTDALLSWYAKHCCQQPKCCYEILREVAPIAVAFDIDCTFAKEDHAAVVKREGLSHDPDAFLATILERIGNAFPQLRGVVPLKSTSHKPGEKLSFHLKFPGWYLKDMTERDRFTAEIRHRLADLIPLIDPQVYSLRRQMRLLFSHKYGDSSRPLLPDGFVAGAPPDMDLVLKHMWSFVPADAVPFYPEGVAVPMEMQEERRRNETKRKRPSDSAPSEGVARDESITRERYTMTRAAFAELYGISFDEYYTGVLSTWLVGGVAEAHLLPSDENDLVGAEIYWRLLLPHKCPNGHEHRSNNFRTRISVGGAVHRACFGDRCNDTKRKRFNWRLLGVLPTKKSAEAVSEQGTFEPSAELSATRHLLRTVLGDTVSVPVTAGGVWNVTWSAPSGRRCCHGAIHEMPTTFETSIAYTHPCADLKCRGTVGGSYWSSRATCSTCSTKHCAKCQMPRASDEHTCAPSDVERVARDRSAADGTVYETCHACSSTPAVLGPLRLNIPRTALPVSADFYATVLAAKHPTWALTPSPIFTCSSHVFLFVFTITDGGQIQHRDGARRVLGITAENDVVLGVKRAPFVKPYAYSSVAHEFRDQMRVWFMREHAATAALLPQPEEHPPRPPLWRLPCCKTVHKCRLKNCQMMSHEPWLALRELKAHGLVPVTGTNERTGGVQV